MLTSGPQHTHRAHPFPQLLIPPGRQARSVIGSMLPGNAELSFGRKETMMKARKASEVKEVRLVILGWGTVLRGSSVL